MTNIYAYLRVSTQDQTIENSKMLIIDYLKKNRYNTDNIIWVSEKKSGFKYTYQERKIGSDILPYIQKNDLLIVSALDRISRKLSNIRQFIDDEVKKKNFTLIIAKYNIKINSNCSPMGDLIINMLAMFAEFEVGTLKERTKVGIKRYKKEHGKWGRPKGEGKLKLDIHKDDIRVKINLGIRLGRIATDYNVSRKTLGRFMKRHKLGSYNV